MHPKRVPPNHDTLNNERLFNLLGLPLLYTVLSNHGPFQHAAFSQTETMLRENAVAILSLGLSRALSCDTRLLSPRQHAELVDPMS